MDALAVDGTWVMIPVGLVAVTVGLGLTHRRQRVRPRPHESVLLFLTGVILPVTVFGVIRPFAPGFGHYGSGVVAFMLAVWLSVGVGVIALGQRPLLRPLAGGMMCGLAGWLVLWYWALSVAMSGG